MLILRTILLCFVVGLLAGPVVGARTDAAAYAVAPHAAYLPAIHVQQSGTQNQPTLLASYVLKPSPRYEQSQYVPRGFAGAPYTGWDVLSLPGKAINDGVNTTLSNADWLTLRLTRAAQIAVVWRGQLTPPTWLAQWTPGPVVTLNGKRYPTFLKTSAKGTVVLGGVNEPGVRTSQPTYLVLLAEQNGQQATAPVAPAGLDQPQPNTTCPAWVHDQYVATGPDGKLYATWHPQIDPVYWCYFRHDHGSDPGLFSADFHPLYGYSMPEAHVGFKGYAFEEGNYAWYITMHFGSGTLAGTCSRFHTTDVALRDKRTGELVADLHLMGDYGKSVINTTHEPLRPPSCPDQANVGSSTGLRLFSSDADGAIPYTPWRLDDRGNILGLRLPSLTIWTSRMMIRCNTRVCDTAVPTGDDGVHRFVQVYPGTGVQAGSSSGEFYTDGMGKMPMHAEHAGALRQYVKPGLNVVSAGTGAQCGETGKYFPVDPWQMAYTCGTNTVQPNTNLNLEGAVKGNN